jgi:hypothetical protein
MRIAVSASDPPSQVRLPDIQLLSQIEKRLSEQNMSFSRSGYCLTNSPSFSSITTRPVKPGSQQLHHWWAGNKYATIFNHSHYLALGF